MVIARAVPGVLFKGIGSAAAELGVTPQHLRLVVMGERPSKRLLEDVRERFPGLLAPGGGTWDEVRGKK